MATLKAPITEQDHIQGNVEAACTLLEYGDYQCPHCGAAYPLVKNLQKHFGNRMRFAYRNFPMTQLHAEAEAAAVVAEFAGTHGKFWEMHDALFENQDRLGDDLFAELATQLGLDAAELQQAMAKRTLTDRVRADFSSGIRSGVNGTPTFFINDRRYDRPRDYDTMVSAIEEALAE
ncbi:MAG TPA: thioredoxin domain-containing protein [Acidobacteriaceae bacterium]|jgi:protein-disulfide isomerase|nr:thioredoxin domain-containing protein [Acidobacteriaceae bacterium]